MSNVYKVQPGKTYWFEYHCYEGHDSADAKLWYHSHQQVSVLRMTEAGGGKTAKDRGDNGHPAVFKVRFADGFEGDVFEDELMNSKQYFLRPDPPKAPNLSTSWYAKCREAKRHRPSDALTLANPPMVGIVDAGGAVFTAIDDSCFGVGERYKTHREYFPNFQEGHGRFRLDEENEVSWAERPNEDELFAVEDYCETVLARTVTKHTDHAGSPVIPEKS